MKKLLLFLTVLVLSGCATKEKKPNPIKDIACSAGKVLGFGLSAEIAKSLECKNEMAINESIFEALVKINVCQAPVEGVSMLSPGFGASMCASVARMAFTTLTAEKFAEWQCTGGEAKEKLFDKVDELCSKIRF